MRPVRPLHAAAVAVAVLANLVVGGTAAAADHLVRITSTLNPASLTIGVGDTVTWRNDHGERHRVRSTSGPDEFDSGNLEPGESFSITLTAPGTYAYEDARDPDLARYRGTITVVRTTSSPAPGATAGLPAGSTGATIGMAGRSFNPSTVTIAAGSSVTFRNDDDRDHTATSTTGAFDTGLMPPGRSVKRTFASPGTFPFLCLIHPDMTGTVVVTGGAGSTPPPAATAPPAATLAPPASSPAPGSERVLIVDLAFTPPHLMIDAGTQVTFENRGLALHTVTAVDGAFDSGLIAPGGAFQLTLARPGTFAFLCSLHPSMTGTIRVRAGNGSGVGPGASDGAVATGAPASAAPSGAAGATAPPDGSGGASGSQDDGTAGGPPGQGGQAAEARAISERPGGFAGILTAAMVLLLLFGTGVVFARLVHEAARDPQRS